MNFAFLILFNIINTPLLPQIEIHDVAVKKAITIYLDSLDSKPGNASVPYQILAKETKFGSTRLLYLATVARLSRFTFELPYAYSYFGDHFIFWFDENKSKSVRFGDFYSQFRNNLIQDTSQEGTVDLDADLKIMSMNLRLMSTIRFVIVGTDIIDVRDVHYFPDNLFKRQDFVYDDKGNVAYKDGGYPEIAWDKPFHYGPFNYFVYIRQHAGLNAEFLKEHNIVLRIIFDVNGKAVKVVKRGDSDSLTENQWIILEKAIYDMPALNVPEIKGQPVSFGLVLKILP